MTSPVDRREFLARIGKIHLSAIIGCDLADDLASERENACIREREIISIAVGDLRGMHTVPDFDFPRN